MTTTRRPDRPARPPRARMSRTIPSELHAPILAWLREPSDSGRPRTYVAAAAWVGETYGVKITRMSVCRLVATNEARGDQLIIAALREELRDAVEPTKAATMRGVRQVDALLQGEDDTAKAAAGLRALTGALEVLAKLGGVAAPVAVDLTSAGKPIAKLSDAELDAEIARLAGRSGEAGGDAHGAGASQGEGAED